MRPDKVELPNLLIKLLPFASLRSRLLSFEKENLINFIAGEVKHSRNHREIEIEIERKLIKKEASTELKRNSPGEIRLRLPLQLKIAVEYQIALQQIKR